MIGSFRRHYEAVLAARSVFVGSGWEVTSPVGAAVIDGGVEFVRFTTDDPIHPDAMVQSLTLRAIFAADAAYVVAPGGYVGRTTCYEIGRLLQADRPIYFSEVPADLPVRVPPGFVIDPQGLVDAVAPGGEFERWRDAGHDGLAEIERELLGDRR